MGAMKAFAIKALSHWRLASRFISHFRPLLVCDCELASRHLVLVQGVGISQSCSTCLYGTCASLPPPPTSPPYPSLPPSPPLCRAVCACNAILHVPLLRSIYLLTLTPSLLGCISL